MPDNRLAGRVVLYWLGYREPKRKSAKLKCEKQASQSRRSERAATDGGFALNCHARARLRASLAV